MIVVDNASSDSAAEVAKSFPLAQLILNPDNRGFAAANNQGIEVARGQYVALVNNDAVIANDWLAKLVAFLERTPRAGAAGGKAYLWDANNPVGSRSNSYVGPSVMSPDGNTPPVMNAPDDVVEVMTLSGAAVVIRRATIDDVGAPFLEPLFFTYYEETDFFARAIRRGWHLYYTGEPACWHRIGATPNKQSYRYHYYMTRNRLLFALRHFEGARLVRVLRRFTGEVLTGQAARLSRFGMALPERDRGYVDAWRWVLDNRDTLKAHRARSRGFGTPYAECERAITHGSG